MTNYGYTTFDIPGASYETVEGITGSGQIFGNYSDTSPNYTRGFISNSGGYTSIDVASAFPSLKTGDYFKTTVSDVDDSGKAVGTFMDAPRGRVHAFLYDNGTYQIVDAPGAYSTYFNGISSAGQVFGTYNNADKMQSFVYKDGAYTFIDVPGSYSSFITGISNAGEIFGTYSKDGISGVRSFVYDGGTYKTFEIPDAASTVVKGISDTGVIFGTTGPLTGDRYGSTSSHAFVYNNGTYTFIDAPNSSATTIQGVSDTGVVFGYFKQGSQIEAFVYADGAYKIIDVPGAEATSVTGINSLGQATGNYTEVDGTSHAFVADPLNDPKTLSITVSADAWNYHSAAQFVVKVDGVQVGGVNTVIALHNSDQTQDVSFDGDFSAAKKVEVTFLNDQYGYAADKDVNLYVEKLTLNGHVYSGSEAAVDPSAGMQVGSSTELTSNGTAAFAVTPAVARDTLTLHVSEDAWAGHQDAQFIVKVDGAQLGGVQTVSALHNADQTQEVTFTGNFANAQKIEVAFLNDQYGNGADEDVNLYVDSVSLNGAAVNGASASFDPAVAIEVGSAVQLFKNGTAAFDLTPDTLTFKVSEDAWAGYADAQFVVKIDGVQIGGVNTVTALHSAGETQDVTLKGHFDSAQKIEVAFLNDQYGGPSEDVNLYVDSISLNGRTVQGSEATLDGASGTYTGTSAELFRNGSLTFNVEDLHHAGLLM